MTGATGSVGELVNYNPPSAGWPSTIIAQISYTGVPAGQNFDVTFPNFVEDHFTGSLSGACYGACQVADSCPGSGTTTITGIVYVPNGTDPLPNALVYIPSTVPGAIPDGVECLTNGNEASGNPIAFTYSKYDGSFTLTGVPSGTNIPIVIQSGKWRMQGTVSTVTACGTTVAPAWSTTMPKNHIMGDIPKIAVVTGNVDAAECVIYRTGVDAAEFTQSTGTGQINLFVADSNGGAKLSGSSEKESDLTSSTTKMNAYDMIMLPCQGSPNDADAAADQAGVLDWANRGGRLFTTHYSYAWLYENTNAASVTQVINGQSQTVSLDMKQGPASAVKWDVYQNPNPPDPTGNTTNATVNTNFTDGATMSNWLETSPAPLASPSTLGSDAKITISTLRVDQDGVNPPTQVWLTLDGTYTGTGNNGKGTPETQTNPVMQLTFNTPVGAGAANQCGKVIYNDYHVYNGTFSGQSFPNECPSSGAMSDQEHLLEYALFDLTNAVTPVVGGASVGQTFVNSPSPAFTQGDAADQITIDVENDGTESLGTTLTLAGVLPTGITVNTSAFNSGGWTCTTSSGGTDFNCTRTTPLTVGQTDAIVVPVAVASNAPTSPTGSLTDTISGGGLTTNVTGTDPLPIIGHPVITWATPPAITYGSPLPIASLDAAATCGGVSVPGTYSYTYGSTTLAAGVSNNLPAGNDTLNVTFTPTTPTSSCPVQTTTVVQVVVPAVLTVTANNATMSYGGPIPAFTDSITGFVNNDGAGVVSGTATMNTTATVTSPAQATYPINFATEGLTAANYTFNYVPGVLNITQLPQAITFNPTTPVAYGVPPITLTATGGASGNPVTFTYVSGPGSLSGTNGSVLTVTGPGTIQVQACQAGNTDYTAATCVTKSIVVTQPTEAITWTPNPEANIVYGAALTSQLNAVATYGGVSVPGTYVYTTGSTVLSSATVLNAGTYPLSVTFTPTDKNLSPQTTTNTITVTPQPQVITFNPASPVSYGVPPITLTATGGASGNPVTFTYVSGPGSLSGANGSVLTVTGTGTIQVQACQAGSTPPSTNYTAATCVTKSIVVTQPTEAITWTPNPEANIVYGAALTSQLNAIATYGGVTVPGTYVYTTGSTVLSSATVLNAGTYPLSVTFTPTDKNLSPQTTTNTITVTPQPQVITFNPASPVTYGVSPITLTATGGASGNPVTFTYVSGPGSLSGTNGSVLTVTGTGTIQVQACQAGSTPPSTNYTAATCVTKSIVVTQPTEAITWTPNPEANIVYGAALTSQLNAIATYGGVTVPGTYVYTTGSTVLSSATVLNAGTYPLSVTFTPTDKNLSPQTTTNAITVTPQPQVITFNPTTPVAYGVPPVTLTATGGASGNPVTFTYVSGPGSLSGANGSVLTVTGTGTIQVQACQAGSTPPSTNYTAATCVTKSIVVTQPTEAITWTPNPEANIVYGAPLTSQLNAIATYGGVTVPGTYVYTSGSTVLSAGMVLNIGTYPLSVTFTPADKNLSPQTTTNTITVVPAPMSVSCPAVNTGTAGVAFNSGPMAVSGGVAPYTYSVVGKLPAGLKLNTSTGVVSGIPTTAGTFSIAVTDSTGVSAATTCSITIAPQNSCSLGVANAYNLISLKGDISDSADITGRIAAAGKVTEATTIGDGLRTSDPYILQATTNGGPYAIVAAGGISAGGSFSLNGGGSVYSSTSTNANFNFANESYSGSPYAGSDLVIGGPSPIDFSTLQANMVNLSGTLSNLTANGAVCTVNSSGTLVVANGCPSNPVHFGSNSGHYNPSWIVLYGTSTTINVFNITQAQFQDNNNLDIEVPTGSTAIVNVAGTSDKLQRDIYFQGATVTDANAGNILFNLATATSVTLDGQIFATVLAPNASLTGGSQMGGVFIAANIGSTGQVHYDAFGGSLPNGCSNTLAALSVTCAAVNTGVVGTAFNSGLLTVTGGTAPYSFSIVGTLPAGLKLNAATGAVTGTPTASGTFSVQVTDANSATGTACPITIGTAQADAPKFSLAAGTFTGVQSVSITDTTSGATIYYTTNGNAPTTGSTVYGGPITVSSTETIKAIAAAAGYSNSTVASAAYTIKPGVAATPTFSPAAGTFTSVQTVSILDATSGATIHYTLDGSAPTTGSPVYGGPITVSSTETIKAIAVMAGDTNSAVASAKYTINFPTAATPTFSPAAGTFTSVQKVSILDATTGATIHYTTDGTAPTITSPVYSGPITVSATETIKAIATNGGYNASAVATAKFTINLPQAKTPSFSLPDGSYTGAQSLTLSDLTAGATIYYTLDGSAPTTSSTPYTGTAITVSKTETIKAIAVATGYSNSAVGSVKITIK
jgi:choice-of-anchor A domain-containing protein